MDDIFYLSPFKLETDSVCKVFQNVDGICVKDFRSSDTIQIYTETQIINMTLMGVFEFYEASQEFIQTHKIASIVCISHHKSYIQETLELAKLLLDRWSGWIGNDSDGFLPIFDTTNILSFSFFEEGQ